MLRGYFSAVFLLVCLSAASAEELSVFEPVATKEALINPGMGWVHFHYSNRLWAYGGLQAPGDTLDWFPGCSTIRSSCRSWAISWPPWPNATTEIRASRSRTRAAR